MTATVVQVAGWAVIVGLATLVVTFLGLPRGRRAVARIYRGEIGSAVLAEMQKAYQVEKIRVDQHEAALGRKDEEIAEVRRLHADCQAETKVLTGRVETLTEIATGRAAVEVLIEREERRGEQIDAMAHAVADLAESVRAGFADLRGGGPPHE